MPGTKLRVRGSVETKDDYSTAMGLSLEREAVKNRTGLPRWLRGKESVCQSRRQGCRRVWGDVGGGGEGVFWA